MQTFIRLFFLMVLVGSAIFFTNTLISQVAAQITSPTYTVENNILYKNGEEIRLNGINLPGAHGQSHVIYGLWARNWQEMITQLKDTGFNAVRIPYCGETVAGSDVMWIDYGINPDLEGLNSLQILDKIIAYLELNEIFYIFDHHNLDCNEISELWYDEVYSEADWIADLQLVAERYQGNQYFMGVDIKNEPHGVATWGTGDLATDFKLAAERAGKAILEVNSDILILVEGVQTSPDCTNGNSYTWGGNLSAVKCFPISEDWIPANKLVYSPHTYGPDVYLSSHFIVDEFPENQPPRWEDAFGFLTDLGYTVLLTEWGGKFGRGLPEDEVWHLALRDWLLEKNICNNFYWTWNPNSGDTGGILEDDWITINQDKVTFLNQLRQQCNDNTSEPVSSPSPMISVCVGDINLDKTVNIFDFSILSADFFTDAAQSDLNSDGTVNLLDFSILSAHFFESCE